MTGCSNISREVDDMDIGISCLSFRLQSPRSGLSMSVTDPSLYDSWLSNPELQRTVNCHSYVITEGAKRQVERASKPFNSMKI